jgi:hypothetical protein
MGDDDGSTAGPRQRRSIGLAKVRLSSSAFPEPPVKAESSHYVAETPRDLVHARLGGRAGSEELPGLIGRRPRLFQECRKCSDPYFSLQRLLPCRCYCQGSRPRGSAPQGAASSRNSAITFSSSLETHFSVPSPKPTRARQPSVRFFACSSGSFRTHAFPLNT